MKMKNMYPGDDFYEYEEEVAEEESKKNLYFPMMQPLQGSRYEGSCM